MTCNEILIGWLNNAYAMELSLAQTLEKHAEQAEELPEIKRKLEEHVKETNHQAERVKKEIERLGGEVSGLKSGLAEAFGGMSGWASGLPKDNIVKNAIAEHASEHFEMAVYLSIEKAATICGEEETAKMAREIMEEEKTTGEELEQKLGMIVEKYLTDETEEE